MGAGGRLGWRAVCAALLAYACVGCYVCERTEQVSGAVFQGEALSAIEVGQTTVGELVAALGEPTSTEALTEGKDVLVYETTRLETTRKRIPLVMNSGSQVTRVVRHNFEVSDGLVVRYWREPAD